MPDPAPVTMTVLPSSLLLCVFPIWFMGGSMTHVTFWGPDVRSGSIQPT
jgi:hypothetical protein